MLLFALTSLIGWLWSQHPLAPSAEPTRRPAATSDPEPGPVAEQNGPERSPVQGEANDLTGHRPEVERDRRGSLRVRVSWSEGSSPAMGVPVRVIPVGVSDSRLNEREGVTDGAGELLVRWLREGRYAPETCLGGNSTVQVEAGREALATIMIPRGASVRGIVVDELGEPVAHAEVWLTYGSFRLIGAVVATAAGDGRFDLRSVDCAATRYIGARGAGFAPSRSVRLVAEAGSSVELRLEVGPVSGAIRGHVANSLGEPQGDALIVIGRDSTREERLLDGTRALAPPPIRERSDAQGDFLVACAPAGRLPVLVRAPGFAPWKGEIDVPQHGEAGLQVVLEPGASLVGTVSTLDQMPVEGAEIRIGDWDDPAGSLARSGADGNYRIDSLASGELEVAAVSRTHGRAAAKVNVPRGEVARWNPVLAPGADIRIRVLDERDAPLVGWTVEIGATVEGEWLSRWGATASDGRFTARNCPEATYVLRVTEPGACFATFQREGVVSSDRETLVRIPDVERATSSIVGIVVDPGGLPVAGAKVLVTRTNDAAPRTLQTESGSGRFGLERIPTGEYTIGVRAPGVPAVALGPHKLEAHEIWDLGEVRLETPGTLILKLRREDGTPVGRPGINCRKQGSPVYDEPVPDESGTARSAPLGAGSYELVVYGEGVVTTRRTFEILAGRVTTLELVIRSGIYVQLVFLDPPSGPPPVGAMHFRAIDAQGEVASEAELTRRPGSAFEWHVGLASGEYRVEAIDLSGIVRASQPLVLRASSSQGSRIEVRLH